MAEGCGRGGRPDGAAGHLSASVSRSWVSIQKTVEGDGEYAEMKVPISMQIRSMMPEPLVPRSDTDGEKESSIEKDSISEEGDKSVRTESRTKEKGEGSPSQ